MKGRTSSNVLDVVEIRVSREQNSLMDLVRLRNDDVWHSRQDGVARHGCYYRRITGDHVELLEG